MRRKHYLPKISALTFLISQALCVPAFAAGFQINEISPSLQGDATAGAAAANNDVSSMFTNPATLSTLIRNQAYLGGSEVIPNIRMNNASAIHTVNIPGIPGSSITAPVAGSTSQNSISTSAFVPDFYLGWRINDRFVAGLAVVAPFGLRTHYGTDSVLRFSAQNSYVKTIVITPAIAYAINDKFSVGLGIQAEYIQAKFSNFNGPYTGIPGIDQFIAAGYATNLSASSWGYGFTIGGLFTPDAFTRLGIGYRSQVSQNLSGNGEQFVGPGNALPVGSAAIPGFSFNAETSVYAKVKTPAVLTLSAARDIGNWTIKASAQVNFWNTFNQLSISEPDAFGNNSTIQTQWKNTWLGAIGADYRITHRWTLKGGLAYDQTPTSSTYRDARIPDSDRVWLALGASYIASKHLSFDAAYTHIFMRNQSINVTQASGSSATTTPLEVNQTQASFKGSADIVALAARYSF